MAVAGVLIFIIFTMAGKTGGRLNLLTQMSSTRAVMVRDAVVSAQKQRLLLALEAYRLEKGSYPMALDNLVQAGFVLESDISYPYSTPYSIAWSENGPVISPPGE